MEGWELGVVGGDKNRSKTAFRPLEVHCYEGQDTIAMRLMDFGATPPEFEGRLVFFLAVSFWVSDLSFRDSVSSSVD